MNNLTLPLEPIHDPHPSNTKTCPACLQGMGSKWLQAPDRFHGRTVPYELMRCLNCSMVWLDNPPSPAEMGAHYGHDYDRAIATAGSDPRHWFARRDTLLSYKSAGNILDLGCSSGGFLSAMKSDKWKLFGIEMSEDVAQQAKRNTGAEVFVGDILDAPFASNSFDAISCFHVFEHLYEPRAILEKVRDWLKPGGIFYAMMPNIDSAGKRIFGSYWYALELPRHLSHFSPTSLRYLATSVGLKEVSVSTHREVFIEGSVRYLVDEGLRRIGIQRAPLAKAKPASLPWKVVRKGFRLTGLPILKGAASLAGDGESIHALFTK